MRFRTIFSHARPSQHTTKPGTAWWNTEQGKSVSIPYFMLTNKKDKYSNTVHKF